MKTHWVWLGLCSVVLGASGAEQPPNRPGLTIKAEFAVADLKNGEVLYTNNVIVTDPTTPPMTMTCRWLTARKNAEGKIDQIVAHDGVRIDHGETHARGALAVYTGADERVVITGPVDPADTLHPLPELIVSKITNTGTRIVYDRLQEKLFIDKAETLVPSSALSNMNKTISTNSARPPKTSPASPFK